MLAAGKFEANALGIPGGAVLTGNLPLKDDGIPDEALSTGKFAHQKNNAIRKPKRKFLPSKCVYLC